MNKGILVVSFGTTHVDTREETIGRIEKEIKEHFKEYDIYRAFTSEMVRTDILECENIFIPNVKEALEQMIEDGIDEIMILPTHIIPGIEYEKMVFQALQYKDKFKKFLISTPLLHYKKDYRLVVEALMEEEKGEINNIEKGHAILFMGHGSKHKADENYKKLQEQFRIEGYENVYIVTIEGNHSIFNTIYFMKEKEISSVTLIPFMIAAGEHVKNDMAGKKEDSLKSILLKSGFRVNCILNGLGENKKIREILVNHLKESKKSPAFYIETTCDRGLM